MEQQTALVVAGRPRRVLLEMLFSVIVYLLGVLDSVECLATAGQGARKTQECRRVHRIEKALQIAQSELTRLQEFADQAAIRAALRCYVLGLFIGGIAVFASAWAASRALLGRGGRGGAPAAQGSAAGVACAGPDAEQGLEFPEDGVERQAGAGTFGSRRNCVQNAWARAVSVT